MHSAFYDVEGTVIFKLIFRVALTGRDFQQLDNRVQLIQGREERLCFDIITINDTAVEGTEAFSVSLTDPVGVTIVKSEETISIDDDGDSEWMGLDCV